MSPGAQPFALAVDQGIEGVKEQRPHPDQSALLFRMESDEAIEDGHHEALGLARARAAGDHQGLRRRLRQDSPRFQLVPVGMLSLREPVIPCQFRRRLIHRLHKRGSQQRARQIGHARLRTAPTEDRLESRIGQESARFAIGTVEHLAQVAVEWRVGETQSANCGQLGTFSQNGE